ncbi:MAG: hypothetical protein K8S62_05950 [Candidatus Sabulitectum sp.]|nr:hypothetical protein [Candidatus Sabulitectum sp.]
MKTFTGVEPAGVLSQAKNSGLSAEYFFALSMWFFLPGNFQHGNDYTQLQVEFLKKAGVNMLKEFHSTAISDNAFVDPMLLDCICGKAFSYCLIYHYISTKPAGIAVHCVLVDLLSFYHS